MDRLFHIILIAACAPLLSAQTERQDSIAVMPGDSRVTSLSDSIGSVDTGLPLYGYDQSGSVVSSEMWRAWAESASIRGVSLPVPGLAVPFSWGSGVVYASGSASEYLGLSAIESGRIGVTQSFGRFTLDMYGEAMKYGFYRHLAKSWGFGASLSYNMSDQVSVTLFGSYYTKPGYFHGSPALPAYVGVPNLGGYFDFSLGGRWGVQVGAQTYRSLTTGQWDAQPIVRPYYRLNGNTEIGVDVGGIIYNILKSNKSSHLGGRVNPTVGPPVGSSLPIGPPGSEPPGY